MKILCKMTHFTGTKIDALSNAGQNNDYLVLSRVDDKSSEGRDRAANLEGRARTSPAYTQMCDSIGRTRHLFIDRDICRMASGHMSHQSCRVDL